jgi:phenylacetate-CoA ligase
MFTSALYARSPVWLQERLISGRARIRAVLREGPAFREALQQALTRDTWSQSELEEYQVQRLREILSFAEKHVPHYRNEFARAGIRVSDLDLPADVSRLPLTSKSTILVSGAELLSERFTFPRIKGSTSGTTGTPVTILQDLDAVIAEHAFLARQLAWAGYRDKERQAWIRGDMITPANTMTGPFWRLNRAENMLMASSYHLSDQTAEAYLQALSDFDPSTIQAYPSSIAFLARALRSRKQTFNSRRLRSIITSSESLTDEARELVQDTFRCPVFDWYGAFERVAAIGTCDKGSYHILTDYSFVELHPAGPDLYEVIGTGFNNRIMPLIRYRTGDWVKLRKDRPQSCDCGRMYPVVDKVLGREDDVIQLPDGRRIGRLDHVFKGLIGIAEAQIVQPKIDEIKVLLVPLQGFSQLEQEKLMANIRSRTGADVRLTIEIVDKIPRSRNGKFRSVVSLIE